MSVKIVFLLSNLCLEIFFICFYRWTYIIFTDMSIFCQFHGCYKSIELCIYQVNPCAVMDTAAKPHTLISCKGTGRWQESELVAFCAHVTCVTSATTLPCSNRWINQHVSPRFLIWCLFLLNILLPRWIRDQLVGFP